MNKQFYIYFLVAAILCLYSEGAAQVKGEIISKPVTNLWYQTPGFKVLSASHDDQQSSMILYQPMAKGNTCMLIHFDNTSLAYKTSELAFPDNSYYPILALADQDNRIRYFYRHDDPSKKICQVFADVLDPELSKIKPVTDVHTFSFEYDDSYSIEYALSPDKRKCAFVILIKNSKDLIVNIHAVICDSDGSVIWENDILPEVEEEMIRSNRFCVSNDGTLFWPLHTFDKNDELITKQHLYLVQANSNGSEMHSLDFDFEAPGNIGVLSRSDGKLLVCGFYKNNKDLRTAESGYFSVVFNPTNGNFETLATQPFATDYFEKYPAIDLQSKPKSKAWYILTCDHLFEKKNGDIVLCGEHRSRTTVFSTDYGAYTEHAGDIVAITFPRNGEPTMQLIPKDQTSYTSIRAWDIKDAGISYHAFLQNDNLYLIYNDAASNIPYPGKGDKLELSPWGPSKKCVSVCTVCKSNGSVEQRTLITAVTEKQMVLDYLFADKESFFVTCIQGKGLSVNKYPLP